MQNVIHYLFISCIHVMLLGSLWCLLDMYSTALRLFCKAAHYIIFASDTDFVLGKCSNNKEKRELQ